MSPHFSSSITDSEIRGPLPYQQTAVAIVTISSLTGALLALGFQRSIGLIPLWAPLVLVPILVVLIFLLGARYRPRPLHQPGKTSELESIYSNAPLGLCSFDCNLAISRANQTMANLFSRSVTSMDGETLDRCAPQFTHSWLPALQAALRNEPGDHHIEFYAGPTGIVDAPGIWGANFSPIMSDAGEVRGVSVVAEDLTEERRFAEEYRAHQIILELAATLAPLDTICDVLATSLETIFPTTLCYIVRRHDNGRGVSPFARTSLPWLRELFAQNSELPNGSHILKRFFDPPKEVIISDVAQEISCPFSERMRHLGIRSCWIKPIMLSNGSAWGACILNHRTIALQPSDTERKHLDLLLHLFASVIERLALHKRLASTAERFECAEKAGKIGVFDWNPTSGSIVWSRQMEVLFGLSEGSFEGTFSHWRRLIDPSDAPKVLATIKQLIACRETWFVIEHRFAYSNGETRWMEVQGSLSYDSKGSPLRGVGVASDITERKRVKELARRDQERLNLALEAGGLGFWDWHIPSGAVQFGGSWAAMLGYSLEELEPSVDAWIKLVHPDDLADTQEALRRHFRRETTIYENEHRLKNHQGAWIWVLDRGRVVEWDALGNPIRAIGIHANINEQRAAREELKQASQRKDEFLATLAHELRNPLAPIRTGLQIIQKDPTGTRASQARDMMERQLNHMVRLVDDLLDVSRITRGQLELKKERSLLQEIVSLAIECSMPTIAAGGQLLHQDIPAEPIAIMGDATRLAQLISNLLVNAAKYTPAGGQISLSAHTQGDRVLIQVSDTGVGIPHDMLDCVFEMFSQVDRTLERSQGGLGIGLALARKIVEMHGGQIQAQSAGTGKGSIFTVNLPRLVEEPVCPPTRNINAISSKELHVKNVCIIDDNVDGAASLGIYLEMLGHHVTIFHSGNEALAQLQGGLPDVIFLDVGLPGMSGYEVAKAIRAMPDGSRPLVAAVTGWGTDDDKRKTAAAGCDIHLTKPIDLTEVDRLVG